MKKFMLSLKSSTKFKIAFTSFIVGVATFIGTFPLVDAITKKYNPKFDHIEEVSGYSDYVEEQKEYLKNQLDSENITQKEYDKSVDQMRSRDFIISYLQENAPELAEEYSKELKNYRTSIALSVSGNVALGTGLVGAGVIISKKEKEKPENSDAEEDAEQNERE